MRSEVITATPRTTLAEALELVRAHRILHLPVVDGGRLVGLVSDRDLRVARPPVWAAHRAELEAQLAEKTVSDVMITDLVTVTPDTPIEEAGRLLLAHRIGCVPVMDGGELAGILTETDLLRTLTELFGARGESERIEVRMPNRPGELARVVRLIGIENRCNITGLVVPPVTGDESVAVMHIQTDDAEHIIGSLRKMGYAVGSPALDADPTHLLGSPYEPEASDGTGRRGRVTAELG